MKDVHVHDNYVNIQDYDHIIKLSKSVCSYVLCKQQYSKVGCAQLSRVYVVCLEN